jgi:hypothetical protein
MERLATLAAAGLAAVVSTQALAQVNVALNKPVTVVSDQIDAGDLATLTDGVFLERGNEWTMGTVNWTEVDTTLEIDLQGTFELFGAIVQADDNDGYVLEYHNTVSDTWELLWDLPNFDAFGNGMQTRPNPENDAEIFVFNTPVVTDKVRVKGIDGDSLYALSEIQLFTRVPAPGAAMLAIGALPFVAGRRRR